MKKLLLLLTLFISISALSQTIIPLRGPIKQIYNTGSGNDTTHQYLSGDSAIWNTSQNRFIFKQPIYYGNLAIPTRTELGDTAAAIRASGIGTESDPIWDVQKGSYTTYNAIRDTVWNMNIDTITSLTGVYINGNLTAPSYLWLNDEQTAGFQYDLGNVYLQDPAVNSGNPISFNSFLLTSDTTLNAESRKLATKKELADTAAAIRASGGGSMVYPGAGIPLSTGGAWGTSFPVSRLDSSWNTSQFGISPNLTTINSGGITTTNGTAQIAVTNNSIEMNDGFGFGTYLTNGDLSLYYNDSIRITGDFIRNISGRLKNFDIGHLRINLNNDIIKNNYAKIDSTGNITTTGNIDYTAGTSSTFVRVPGVLKDFLADSTTSGTGETDLYSYTVPANVLSSDGDKIVFNLTITSITASATVTYIRCYFGGDYITIVNGETFTYPNGILNVKIEIIKTGSSSFRMVGIPNSENVTSNMDYANITGVNFAIPNIVKVTGQCATNSIVARFGYIEYKPAATN